jgi:hypothetical protein
VATVRTKTIGVALVLALTAEGTAYALLIKYTDYFHAELLAWLSGPSWVLAVWLFSRCRVTARQAAIIVLGVSAVLQVIALTSPPSTSDDSYRYVWDAKVQLAGVDPYRYTPSAPQLQQVRDPTLFGRPDHCQWPFPGGCTSINRPTVHTIYPPVAEAAFVVARVMSFGGHGDRRPLQIAGLLGSLLIGWLLLRWALARGKPWLATLWAWCPVTITEYANNAHIDWLAVLFVVLSFGTGAVRRTGLAGALVGAAIAVKLYPALVLPALMRRNPVVAVGAAVGVVVLVYIPHVMAVGSAVIGYLPGYLHEESFQSGRRLLLLRQVVPQSVATLAGAAILAAVAIWAWRRGDPESPERSAVVVVGVALLVFTPSYSWYCGLLLALVAMTGALEWVPLVFAGTAAYLVHSDHDVVIYVVAASATATIAAVRHVDSLRRWPPWISPMTDRSRSSRLMPRP